MWLEILCECLFDGSCFETLLEFEGQIESCAEKEGSPTHWRRAFDYLQNKDEMISSPDNQWRCTNHTHALRRNENTTLKVSICISIQN